MQSSIRRCMLAVAALIGATAAAQSAPMQITVAPAAAGPQLVRASLPFPPGALEPGQGLVVSGGGTEARADVRILTTHPGGHSARRALVTFSHTFPDDSPVDFTLRAISPLGEVRASPPAHITVAGDTVTVEHTDGWRLTARLIAPPTTGAANVQADVVDVGRMFRWERHRIDDPAWPRTLEVRVDRLGAVTLVGHLQRTEEGFGYCPDFGWSVGVAAGGPMRVYDPTAELRGKDPVDRADTSGQFTFEHLAWSAADKAPVQQAMWRRAILVIQPSALARLTPTLQYPHTVTAGPPRECTDHPRLRELIDYHHQAVARSVARGPDWGNVTGYSDAAESGYTSGMNRLNHCPPIVQEAWRTGDRRLIEVGVLWCDNMHDQSLWWGPDATGGTRYNNLLAMGQAAPFGDQSYMWRSNSAVNFCTKGYDAFSLAYEETGDPRMLEALEAQVAYAAEHVHANTGEARNIGDVRDFVRLYTCTGEQRYLDQALRLFREVREKLSTGDLFSQSGRPLADDPPFIDDDQRGYALAGLPELARHAPDEPRLRDVIQAVADFLAESMDPLGGWRYPHPRSSYMILSQGIEHAWQLVQADRLLGPQESHLDAIEAVLRQRLHCWLKTGKCLNGLGGWEIATGKVKSRSELYELYQKPTDRDFERDYSEGDISVGGSSPEGLVYFPEVLAYYLEHRPAESLFREPREGEPLATVLGRL